MVGEEAVSEHDPTGIVRRGFIVTTSKWAQLAKCSQDTALRDIEDLIRKKVLVKDSAGGRSTSYSLAKVR